MSGEEALCDLRASRGTAERGVEILGVRFDRLTRSAALAALEQSLGRGEAWKVYIVNAHTLNLAFVDQEYREVLNRGTLVLNDGAGAQIASYLAGRAFLDNLVGTDLTPQICERASRIGVGVFLLGGRPGVAEAAGRRLQRMLPSLKISGTHQGYFSQDDTAKVIQVINHSKAGILLVGFGNPDQEKWIHRYSPFLRCDLCIGVGGLFDQLSGRLRRAPMWMRRLGMEWIQILIQQPHKWRRYLVGNPVFMGRIIAERFQRKR